MVDLASALEDVEPADMVAASDGSLWILETGRGRIVRLDPAEGGIEVVYRAGQELESGEVPGDPWLIATAATDVVVIDRARGAWRIDLAERVPRRMELNGVESLSSRDDAHRRPPAPPAARDLHPLRGRPRRGRDLPLDPHPRSSR